MNCVLFVCEGFCLGSFIWGMLHHFRREGRPSRWMLFTSLLALVSAVVQIASIVRGAPRFPGFAVVLYSVSAGLFWWSVTVTWRKLAACGQGCVSNRVVTNGPYRHIRHPFYAAYNLAWLAGFASSPRLSVAISVLVMAALYERFAREEERAFLGSAIGPQYRAYIARSGKYLPRVILMLQ